MPDRPSVTGLFEPHLLVRDLERSVGFYRYIVGLELACEGPCEVSLDDLLEAPRRLREKDVIPLSFFGQETDEPTVIGWMQAATLNFRDPDGNMLEYLTMLDTKPSPDRGIVPYSEWVAA